jgi:flagellar biosynthesis chaperone FliJ
MKTQNQFHQNRDEMQKDVNIAGAYQPDGPVKADIPVAAKPDHVDFQVVRNDAMIQLAELIEELKNAKDEFATFKSNLSPDVETLRRDWSRKRPEEDGRNHDAVVAWQNSDPELQDLDAVVAAKRTVEELKQQLTEAQSELDQLYTQGTARAKYTRAVISAGSVINSIASGLQRAAFEDVLCTLYRTRDLSLIPEQAVENARIHPDVFRYRHRVTHPLDPLRTEFGDLELANAHNRVVREVERLTEIIREA